MTYLERGMSNQSTMFRRFRAIVGVWLVAMCLVNAYATGAQMPTDDLPSPDCKIDLQNLDEVVHKSLSGQLDSMFCMSKRLYDHYWNAAPPPVTAIQRKYAPKGKSVRHYARFYFRDYKILSSKDIAPIDGKPARSYQVKVLYVLMQFADTGEEKPLCETATYTVKFAKELWGWHEVPGVWSGTSWQAASEISKQRIDDPNVYAPNSADKPRLAQQKAVSRERVRQQIEREERLVEQCQTTL
jgi:hypothetical protein